MKKTTKIFMIIVMMSTVYTANAQVAINTDGSAPNVSAMLDVKSTDKGFLPPRMTAEQMKGLSPVDGLIVYNTNVKALCVYNGSKWDCMDAQSIFNKTFYCGDNLRDFRDGQTYSTVQIGTQCWIAENMNIGTMVDVSVNQADNSTIEKYCTNNDVSYCDTYGGLYQWDEAMQYETTEGAQGICPLGWHLPTDEDFKTLETSLGMSSSGANSEGWRGTDEGSKLAGNEPLWHNGVLDQNANFGSSGFTALPAGYRNTNGGFNSIYHYNDLWTSSEDVDGVRVWLRYIHSDHTQVLRNRNYKKYGVSVRCVRD